MRITNDGKVGIGTSSPIRKFNVYDSADSIVGRIQSGQSSSWLQFAASGTGTASRIGSPDGASIASIALMTNDTERMRIDSSGNVGIGTSSPNSLSGYQVITLNGSSGGIFDLSVGNTRTGSFTASSGSVTVQSRTGIPLIFQTFASERMRIDSTGNVGIGTTSPDAKLSVNGVASFGDGAESLPSITNFGDLNTGMWFPAGDTIGFSTAGGERMRIDSSGFMHIGSTVLAYNQNDKAISITPGVIYSRRETTLARGHLEFYNPNGGVGSISTTNSSTAYNTTSDYRLKENISYDFDATTRLKQLKPARFNFIADANITVDGFIAHEVQDVVPEAITGTKDAIQVWEEGEELPEGVSVGDNKLDGEGNTIPVYQGIDQAKLVPLLVKTIQELEARITALETQP